MIRFYFFIFFAISLFGQVRFDTLFILNLNNLPEKPRIENCGIYAISDFLVEGDKIYLRTFDSGDIYCIANNQLSKLNNSEGLLYFSNSKVSNTKDISTFAKNIKDDIFFGKDGKYFNSNGFCISIIVNEKGNLYLVDDYNSLSIKVNTTNVFYADLIGQDINGYYYLIIEKIINNIPLKVKREIIILDKNGLLINTINIPTIKYLTILNEFHVNKSGELIHFISDSENVTILKVSNLTVPVYTEINYPEEFYNKYVHYDLYTTNREIINNNNYTVDNTVAISRLTSLNIADSYVNYKFTCKNNNLAPNGVTAPDGDLVKTPPYLIVGRNGKIPYMWGGFSSLSDFYSGITYYNYYAGDIHTSGVSSYAVGVDCSGFVSRCWQLSYHASTAYMPNITTQLSDWTKLKPADAILKPGHVRLFINKAQNGALRIAEASARDWAVSYWSYAISDLSAYTPNKYNSMENNFNETLISLNSSIKANNKVILSWQSDTTNVIGYRLYRSNNGKNWYLLMDENLLKTSNISIDLPLETTFYKVSIVKNISNSVIESNYSNILGVNSKEGAKNYLIIDGFNRNIGNASFQGIFNPFSISYGLGLKSAGVSFDNIKNIALKTSSINLSNYEGIFWYVGDESVGDESIDDFEQNEIKNYLDNGGNLFICGSEIGWDLWQNGTASDKDFYANYLKALYIEDNSLSKTVKTTYFSIFDSLQFRIGQTYDEDYPDVIAPTNGSVNAFNYANNKGAGIVFDGYFNNPNKKGKLVYLAFPLESTADDTSFNKIIRNVVIFFENQQTIVENNDKQNLDFIIYNAYPNPFNSSTNLNFTLNNTSNVKLTIYNLLGEEISVLINETLNSGKYNVKFENNYLSTGIYIANFKINNKIYNLKLLLIK